MTNALGEGEKDLQFRGRPRLEVSALSGWVSPLSRPYSRHYSGTFAFSTFLYPLHHPRSLRFGYHRSGARGAYPVDLRGLERLGVGAICDPAGVVSTAVCRLTIQSYLLAVLAWCISLFHHLRLHESYKR